jgi:hypothetical protein
MSYPSDDFPSALPPVLTVKVNNWPDNEKTGKVRKTSVKTWVVDPASADWWMVQISEYEPTRLRMVVQVLDAPVSLVVGETPKSKTDTTTASLAPGQGRVLVNNTAVEYVFYGPDDMYVYTLGTIGRVTVTKEYE